MGLNVRDLSVNSTRISKIAITMLLMPRLNRLNAFVLLKPLWGLEVQRHQQRMCILPWSKLPNSFTQRTLILCAWGCGSPWTEPLLSRSITLPASPSLTWLMTFMRTMGQSNILPYSQIAWPRFLWLWKTSASLAMTEEVATILLQNSLFGRNCCSKWSVICCSRKITLTWPL